MTENAACEAWCDVVGTQVTCDLPAGHSYEHEANERVDIEVWTPDDVSTKTNFIVWWGNDGHAFVGSDKAGRHGEDHMTDSVTGSAACRCPDPLREVHPGCPLHGHSPEKYREPGSAAPPSFCPAITHRSMTSCTTAGTLPKCQRALAKATTGTVVDTLGPKFCGVTDRCERTHREAPDLALDPPHAPHPCRS